MRLLTKTIVTVLRVAARVFVWAVAATFWLLRGGYHAALIGGGTVDLIRRRGPRGAVRCSSCGELIGAEAALECTACHFRWWGSLWSPCPGPDCSGPTTSWVICPHCNFSSTNPYLVGRDLPE